LPVVTVNVPEVDVQFLRVKNQNLPEFLDQVISANRSQRLGKKMVCKNTMNMTTTTTAAPCAARSITTNWTNCASTAKAYTSALCHRAKAEQRSVTYIPVEDIRELQEPGVYVAVMSQPGRFRYDYQTTYFYVSDIGLHLRLFDKSADAFVSSLTNGKAIGTVEVSWLDQQGKVLARAETDSAGRAHFAERPKDAKVYWRAAASKYR